MKNVFLLVAIVAAFMSCNCQKKAVENSASTKVAVANQEQLPKLEYVANTRGFFEKITIENKMVSVATDRNNNGKGEQTKISDADYNELVSDFKKIKLNDLATFKDPTQKRFYDGAAIANLKVTTADKIFQTTDFDHGYPPVEIEKLVNKIVSFGKKE